MKGWDIIGDIHGQLGKLEGLLDLLGYEKFGGAYRHPERRVLFLGDYIDRGPQIEGVLRTVRAMVNEGEAVALLGNHELNALHYHTRGADGEPLRPHTEDKRDQHAATLEQFDGREDDWRDWLRWFAQLPIYFETDNFRAIHACWSEDHLKDIVGHSLEDDAFLYAASDKGRTEGRALEILLKGPELDLPAGQSFTDKEGHGRDSMRIRWWGLDADEHLLGELVMPPGAPAPGGIIKRGALADFPNYPSDAKTVFCGHYWLPHGGDTAPLATNVMCLDYSAGKNGPLVACRWNGSLAGAAYFVSPKAA